MKPTFRTLKIDDASALQALVVEYLESLEPGLKLLDERALLGGGTIDLIAMDGDGHLVLIAVGLVPGDAMVLRMLDAFAWCLEYPDTVRRLYALTAAGPATAPRVFFIGERMSDAFLRKIRHLRMPSVHCMEFCYIEVNGVAGLYFNPVDATATREPMAVAAPSAPSIGTTTATARAAAVPVAAPVPRPLSSAAPVAPVAVEREIAESEIPERRHIIEREIVEPTIVEPKIVEPPPMASAPVEHAPMPAPTEPVAASADAAEPVVAESETPTPVVEPPTRTAEPEAPAAPRTLPADLLKGLRMPENLSSQWRRILSRAVDAPDPAKIRVVREYLQSEFAGTVVYDFYEHQRSAQVFQVQNNHGAVMHMASVSDDFFDANAEADIRGVLDRQRLARTLRDAGPTGVLISAAGVRAAKA